MKAPIYTEEEEVQNAFWEEHSRINVVFTRAHETWKAGARHNQLHTDVRCAFSEYVDRLAKAGDISEELAGEVTL